MDDFPDIRMFPTETDLMNRIEQLVFDLSQIEAEKERLKQENTQLQGKLARMKQSIAGQEKLWLQTKTRLTTKIMELQERLMTPTFIINKHIPEEMRGFRVEPKPDDYYDRSQ